MSEKKDKVEKTENKVEEAKDHPNSMKDKFPELWALKEKFEEEKAAILKKTTPLREERDRLLADIQPTLDKIKKLEKKYLAIERPRLADLDNQIGALAKAMGGKKMSDASPPETEKGK